MNIWLMFTQQKDQSSAISVPKGKIHFIFIVLRSLSFLATKFTFYYVRFKSKGQMKKHAKLHENVFNFVCAECGRKFQRACALKVHMRIHTGEQPFKCRYCEKSFPHNTTLMVNLQLDLNE